MNILIVEDDRQTASFIQKGLVEAGYVVDHAANGEDGLHLALTGNYDALIVDRMLPKRDGLSLIQHLRSTGMQTPVLILSALGEVDNRVDGLRAGGDDYLVKPYAFSELLARLQALLRRVQPQQEQTLLKVRDLEMDLLKRRVTRAGTVISLQPREFNLLEYFMRHAGQVVTRTMLLENVWGFNFDPKTNIVETHISRLRAKIDRDFDKELIKTVRGAGYVINDA